MTTHDDHDPLEMAARLRLATARLARRLRQHAGSGLSPSLTSALASIEQHGPLTLGRLAKIEQVAPPTVTRVVGKLEDDGLVSRQVDATDRRITRVEVTAEGHRRLDHSRQRRNAWLLQQLDTFDAEQLRDVGAALRVMEALAAEEPSPEAQPAQPAVESGAQ